METLKMSHVIKTLCLNENSSWEKIWFAIQINMPLGKMSLIEKNEVAICDKNYWDLFKQVYMPPFLYKENASINKIDWKNMTFKDLENDLVLVVGNGQNQVHYCSLENEEKYQDFKNLIVDYSFNRGDQKILIEQIKQDLEDLKIDCHLAKIEKAKS